MATSKLHESKPSTTHESEFRQEKFIISEQEKEIAHLKANVNEMEESFEDLSREVALLRRECDTMKKIMRSYFMRGNKGSVLYEKRYPALRAL